MARCVVSVWLAAGVLPLAACAPPSNPPALSSQAPAQVGSIPQAASSASGFSNGAPEEPSQSKALTDYLHRRRLPLVGARVLTADGGPRRVILYGFVATAFGKADAADRAREFLNDPAAQVQNRIKIAPEIARHPETPPPPASNPSGNDLKAYQDQQLAAQQLRQYQNQGSAGMVPLMPLLGLFSSFGSFGPGGMGGMGYGFGGAPLGGFGPGWGAYPPYPTYPGLPGIGYPSPYSPIFP